MIYLTLFLSLLIFFAHLMFISKKQFQKRPLLDRLIGAFLLTCFQIVFSELIIGLLGLIYRWIAIFLNVLIVMIIIWISKPLKSKWQMLKSDIMITLQNFWKIQVHYPIIAMMTFWLIILLVYHVFLAWLLPETVWDSLRYHLPAAAQIIQNHKITDVATDTIFINTYPKNFELIFLWLMLLPGSDIWVNAGQIPFFIFGILSIYRLSRLSKLSRHHSWMIGVLLAGSPVILQQLTVSLIDVMFSVSAIIAVWSFYRFVRGGDTFDIILAGVGAGLAAGGKASGVIWVALLGILVLIFLLILQKAKNPRQILSAIVCFAIPVILLTSYWYGKNWLKYGNPIEPYRFSLLGHDIFKGEMDSYKYLIEEKLSPELYALSPLERIWRAWQEPVIRHSSFGALGGLGSVWFILLLPALPVALVFSSLQKKSFRIWLYVSFLLPFFIFLKYQCFTRYHIFLLALGLVAFGIILDEYKGLGRPLRAFAFLLFLFSSVHGSINKYATPQMIRELIHLHEGDRNAAVTFSYRDTPYSSYSLLKWWRRQDIRNTLLMYHCDQWIFTYPLWDSSLNNRVQYLPKIQSPDLWRQRIKRADWIIVSRNSEEENWTDKASSFKKVYSDELFVAYKKMA